MHISTQYINGHFFQVNLGNLLAPWFPSLFVQNLCILLGQTKLHILFKCILSHCIHLDSYNFKKCEPILIIFIQHFSLQNIPPTNTKYSKIIAELPVNQGTYEIAIKMIVCNYSQYTCHHLALPAFAASALH